jgi:hypothetical protein
MKKWQIIGIFTFLIIGTILVSGCTQDNNKNCSDNFHGTYYDPSSKMCEHTPIPTLIPEPIPGSIKNSQNSSNSAGKPPIISPIATPIKNLETGLISKSFPYILRGKSGNINTNLYSGVNSEILSHPSPVWCTRYNYDSSPCTSEETHQYLLKYLDDSDQKKYLGSLVNSIKSITPNKDDQARIAISLVQNIPYDYSKSGSLSTDVRFPYRVLYENTGICEEKSLLLAYLLRELGYGVVLFEFKSENHMAVGVKSPPQYSYKNSGYAFIESTTPSIITDSQGNYVGAGKLTSTPQIFQISEGNSMTSISEEYNDVITYYQIYNQINQIHTTYGSVLDQYQYSRWLSLDNQFRSLSSKYGIKFTTSS